MLSHAFIRFHILSNALICFHTLSNAFIRFQTISNAFIRFHTLTYAYIHLHTLTYAYIRLHTLLLCFYTLLHAFTCIKPHFSAKVSQEQEQQDRESLVYRLYLRKPVKNLWMIEKVGLISYSESSSPPDRRPRRKKASCRLRKCHFTSFLQQKKISSLDEHLI